eukprot:787752-Pelagomonas_calceolata.AAC.1
MSGPTRVVVLPWLATGKTYSMDVQKNTSGLSYEGPPQPSKQIEPIEPSQLLSHLEWFNETTAYTTHTQPFHQYEPFRGHNQEVR